MEVKVTWNIEQYAIQNVTYIQLQSMELLRSIL